MPKMQHPVPIELSKPIPPEAQLPLSELGPLVEPIEAITTLTQAPPALALQAALATMSLVTQAHANVKPWMTEIPLSLFLISIAGSSERKSTVDTFACRAVREYEEHRMEDYRRSCANSVAGRKGRRSVEADDEVVERDDFSRSGRGAEENLSPQILFEDATIEGLIGHLDHGQPSIGIFSDEGGKILGGYSMAAQNQKSTAAALSGMWDGKAISRTRGGVGNQYLPHRRVALHLSIQPRMAEDLFANEELVDQGILNRVLVVRPSSTAGTRLLDDTPAAKKEREMAKVKLARFDKRVNELLQSAPHKVQGAGREVRPKCLTLDPGAFQRFREFYNQVERDLREGERFERIRGFAGKAAEQAARIAAVLTVFGDPSADEVSEKSFSIAVKLMNYYLAEALRLFDVGAVCTVMRDAERMRDWLLNQWKEPLIDVGVATNRGPNRFRSADRVREIFRVLADYGWIIPMNEPAVIDGKRRRKPFRIVLPDGSTR